MATVSEIAKGLHLVKLRKSGGSASVTLPETLRHKVGFFVERGFIAVRAVGPVIVLAQVRQGTPDGASEESDEAIDAAVREWLATPEHAQRAMNGETAKSETGNGAANGSRG